MKRIVIAAFALSLFAACNNDKKEKDTKDADNTNTTNTTTTTTTTTDGGWTAQYKETFMNQCVQGSTATMGAEKAGSYCSCMYDKLKDKYPAADSLNNMSMQRMQEVMQTMAKDCIQ